MTGPATKFTDFGFPPRTRIRGLIVSEPARCLVASVASVDDGTGSLRLFVRSFAENTYREIALPTDCSGFRDPFASPVAPVLYATGLQWQDGGGNYAGVYRIQLPSGGTELAFPGSRVTDAAGAVHRREQWISSLHGFAADGRRLFATLARSVQDDAGTSFGHAMCAWEPDTGTIEPLAALPGIFF